MTIPDLIALLAVLLPFLVSAATILYTHAVARLPHNKAALLTTIAQTAVQAMQQQSASLSNTQKKNMATEIVQSGLKSLGVSVNPLLVEASIESVVYALKQAAPIQAQITVPLPPVVTPVSGPEPIILSTATVTPPVVG
jgi:Bacteriophage holin of superfamily 6 (Holin_LLH)